MHTFLTPEPITVEIRNASGEIRVDLADVASTTVDVVASTSHPLGFLDDLIRSAKSQFVGGRSGFGAPTDPGPDFADDPVERVRVDLRPSVDGTGAGTLIVDTDPARNGWKSSFTVHVTAPKHSGIRIQSQSAEVAVTGPAERLEVRTASGDVRVDDVYGPSVVQTASGEITVRSTSSCDLRSASGEIQVRHVSGEAVVHSTSGDVQVDVAGGDVKARTVSGELRVLDVASGRVELVSVSGDVEIGIHPGSLAAVDFSTVSGRTDTDLPVTDSAPVTENEPESPTLDLSVKTTSGDIRVRRAATV
jgi:hypothetical protein